MTFAAGLGESHHPTLSAAWADYDNDGHVDLYVGNEHLATDGFASPGQLFRNNGDGTFMDVASTAGVENLSFTKGVAWGDYDGDRFPDLYVSNLGDPNHLYHNNGDGTFTDVAETTRTAKPQNSFPAWFWDYDNDGILDLYVPSYYGMSPGVEYVAAGYIGAESNTEASCLYRGVGEGRFVEVAGQCQIERTALPTSDHTQVLDAVDLDQVIRVTEFEEGYARLSLPEFRLGGKPEATE